MQLMHALAVQLSEKVLDEPIFLRKARLAWIWHCSVFVPRWRIMCILEVDWIQELWLALDLEDEAGPLLTRSWGGAHEPCSLQAVDSQAKGLCAQLIEERRGARGEGSGRFQLISLRVWV